MKETWRIGDILRGLNSSNLYRIDELDGEAFFCTVIKPGSDWYKEGESYLLGSLAALEFVRTGCIFNEEHNV